MLLGTNTCLSECSWCYCAKTNDASWGYCSNPKTPTVEQVNLQHGGTHDTVVVSFVTFNEERDQGKPECSFGEGKDYKGEGERGRER